MLVSGNLVSTVSLTIHDIRAHLTKVLFKDIVVVLRLSEDHFLAELDGLEHLLCFLS